MKIGPRSRAIPSRGTISPNLRSFPTSQFFFPLAFPGLIKKPPQSRWFHYYKSVRLESFRLHIISVFAFVQWLEGVFAGRSFVLSATVLWSVVTASVITARSSVATVSAVISSVVSWATVFAVVTFTFFTLRSRRSC